MITVFSGVEGVKDASWRPLSGWEAIVKVEKGRQEGSRVEELSDIWRL